MELTLTDQGNAERLVDRHGEDLRYCYPWGKWLVWDGRRWRVDDSGEIVRRAKETARSIYEEAAHAPDDATAKALGKWAKQSLSEARIGASIKLAQSEPGIPVLPEQLDADPWLLNTETGTVDLRTAQLLEHRREALITKLAPVRHDQAAAAPTWEAFLERVLPSQDLRRFVQRAAGYSLTGDTSEQAMFINHGTGANGKSTFQEALAAVLGDYAMRAPTEMLMAKRSGGIPNDVARLKGARFVAASESEEGRRLAESMVKDLTGQDTLTARFMRAEFFDFRPTHKLWLSTNHRPEIRGTDTAIWRRIRLIPWAVTVPPAEQDRKLREKLREELPGILAWLVQGCMVWRLQGLQAPEEVRQATSAYRADMDVLGTFLEERCVTTPNAEAKATPLYEAYEDWAERSNERPENRRKFGMLLTERGFTREKRGGTYRWLGVGLLAGEGGPDGPDGPGKPGDGPGDGPGGENPANTEKKGGHSSASGPLGPKSDISAEKLSRVMANEKTGPDGPDGPGSPSETSEEQDRRIRELVRKGFSEASARAEVLATDHPLDCGCEVCS